MPQFHMGWSFFSSKPETMYHIHGCVAFAVVGLSAGNADLHSRVIVARKHDLQVFADGGGMICGSLWHYFDAIDMQNSVAGVAPGLPQRCSAPDARSPCHECLTEDGGGSSRKAFLGWHCRGF
jgi:hypothetical protein